MKRPPFRLALAVCFVTANLVGNSNLAIAGETGNPGFSKDVLPILRANCFGCHQDAKKQGGYLMTDFQSMLRGGESGSAAIAPKDAASSHLIAEITPVDGKANMPKNGEPLKPTEIEIIKRWIDAGAISDVVDDRPRYSQSNPPNYERPPSIVSMDFSTDGTQIAVTGFHEVLLFGTDNWQLQNRLIGMSPRLESIRYSPDGKWIAVGAGTLGTSGELQLWNRTTQSLERSLAIGQDTLFGVSWNPDSSAISLGLSDNSVRAVDLNGKQLLYQRVHEDWPRSTVFTIDGKHLISGSRDMTVKLTEVETERFIDNVTSITPGALRGGVQALARHPLRNEILIGSADGVPKIYRVFRQTARVIGDDANLVQKLDPMPGRIFGVAISPDGKYLAAASTVDNQSVVKVWSYDIDSLIPEEIKGIQNKPVASITAEERKKLDAYVTSAPQLLGTWQIADAAIYSVALDRNGRVAAGGSDGHLRVWNIADSKAIADIDTTPSKSADSNNLASLAQLRRQRLSDIASQHQSQRVPKAESDQQAGARPEIDWGRVKSIQVEPSELSISRWNDSAQVIVSATLDTGDVIDATGAATFTSDADNVWVSPRGWVQGLSTGSAKITVQVGALSSVVPVSTQIESAYTVDFIRDVNPVLSRIGCNAGTCHGAQVGKGGLKLSLRGYDPVYDVRSLGDDLAGRRINPAFPLNSLSLAKPLGLVPHVGGKLFEQGDTSGLVIHQWIAAGGKLNPASARVSKITVSPLNPIIAMPGGIQQLRVVATYADGSTRDVTREAFIESGNTEVASVLEGARAQALRRGEAPVLARFEGAYAATTLTVMGDRGSYESAIATYDSPIDKFVADKWARLKIRPSNLCNDAEFLRRVYLDLTGMIPTPQNVREFLADTTPSAAKRERVIDELLASEAFVDHWTNKWSDLLQVNSKFLGKEGATKFRDWIRASFASNKPYDKFVYEVLTASGSNRENPAASYFKILRTPEEVLENSTHLFLGVRFNCNKCHDHPFERWTQDQYYQTAAYFSQIGLKKDEASGASTIGGTAVEGAKPLWEEVFDSGSGDVKHQKTGQVVAPKLPFECSVDVAENASRRTQFAAWVTSHHNPYFAKSFVNRMWGYLLGKGLIEPIDDIRAGNPASIPELLDYLEHDFIDHGFDMRHVMRTICRSRTYQLSIDTNKWNSDDDRNYSHAMPRRLPAEVLYDSIHQATGAQTKLPGLAVGSRAAQLSDADAGLPDGFLNNLGRPARESACECERSNDLRLGSIMALVSGPTLGTAISDPENAIRKLIDTQTDEAILIDELFMRVMSRHATAEETQAALSTMTRIQQDHQSILASLTNREAWWIGERQKRQAELDSQRDAAKLLAVTREEEIKPAREAAEKARLERLAASQVAVQTFEASLDNKLEDFLKQRKSPVAWQTLMTSKSESSNGAILVPQSDRSIRASGNAGKGIYTIDTTMGPQPITCVRLEALTASDLPNQGPGLAANGNFVVTEIELFAGLPDNPGAMRKLKIARGLTDFDQGGFSAAATFDDKLNDQGGWAVYGAHGAEHWAVFALAEPLQLQSGEVLQWRIHQFHDAPDHRLGRFRLSAGHHTGDLSIGLSESLSAIANLSRASWTPQNAKEGLDYLKSSSSELLGLRDAVNRESQPLPEDEQLVVLRKRVERLSMPLTDDSRLVRLRADVKESESQLSNARLTSAQDLVWALVNSPAFLYNH